MASSGGFRLYTARKAQLADSTRGLLYKYITDPEDLKDIIRKRETKVFWLDWYIQIIAPGPLSLKFTYQNNGFFAAVSILKEKMLGVSEWPYGLDEEDLISFLEEYEIENITIIKDYYSRADLINVFIGKIVGIKKEIEAAKARLKQLDPTQYPEKESKQDQLTLKDINEDLMFTLGLALESHHGAGLKKWPYHYEECMLIELLARLKIYDLDVRESEFNLRARLIEAKGNIRACLKARWLPIGYQQQMSQSYQSNVVKFNRIYSAISSSKQNHWPYGIDSERRRFLLVMFLTTLGIDAFDYLNLTDTREKLLEVLKTKIDMLTQMQLTVLAKRSAGDDEFLKTTIIQLQKNNFDEAKQDLSVEDVWPYDLDEKKLIGLLVRFKLNPLYYASAPGMRNELLEALLPIAVKKKLVAKVEDSADKISTPLARLRKP